jgi:hypothetical protein
MTVQGPTSSKSAGTFVPADFGALRNLTMGWMWRAGSGVRNRAGIERGVGCVLREFSKRAGAFDAFIIVAKIGSGTVEMNIQRRFFLP